MTAEDGCTKMRIKSQQFKVVNLSFINCLFQGYLINKCSTINTEANNFIQNTLPGLKSNIEVIHYSFFWHFKLNFKQPSVERYQRLIHPRNLNLIENKDSVIFLSRKLFDSDNFSIVTYKQKMHKSLLQRNHK